MIYTVIDYFKTIYFNTDSGKPYMSMESQRCSGLILESQLGSNRISGMKRF